MKFNYANGKKTIVFIPTYDYLSNKLFLSFVDRLKDFNTIYINNDEYQEIKEDYNIISKFSYYLEVSCGRKPSKTKTLLERLKTIFIKNNILRKKILYSVKNIKPDLIITTSDMSISFKSIKRHCDKKNIPMIIMQPSFFDYAKTSNMSYKDGVRKIINIFFEIYPKQAVWGAEDKNTILFLWGNFFKEFYNKEKDIRIVGNPVYDSYTPKPLLNKSNENLKGKLGISKQKVVTICTEAFGGLISNEDTSALFNLYSEIIRENQNNFFIIKLHPRDSLKDVKLKLKLNYSNYILIKDEYSLLNIFHITDIQVSVASTSSLEAILLNIPVILINPNRRININNFFNGLVELRANNLAEFNECINIVSSKYWVKNFTLNRRKFLSLYLDSLGSASLNIKKEICLILND